MTRPNCPPQTSATESGGRPAGRSPAQLSRSLTGRDYISYSALNLYRQCPLQYRFRYVDQRPEPLVSASLVFGGAVHAALQRFFQEQLTGRSVPLTELMEVFHQYWQAETKTRTVQYAKGEDAPGLKERARSMLQAFLASPQARPEGRIVGVEEELVTKLADDVPPLLARVDLLVDTGRELRIIDLKTARTRWTAEQAEQAADQLWLYAQAARRLIPQRRLKLEFVVLTKTRQPAVQTLPVPLQEQHWSRVRELARLVWRAITAGLFYPAPSPLRCPTCPFQPACRPWPTSPELVQQS